MPNLFPGFAHDDAPAAADNPGVVGWVISEPADLLLGIVGPIAQQGPFMRFAHLGAVAPGGRPSRPSSPLVTGGQNSLQDRIFKSQPQEFIHASIHKHTIDRIVIVLELGMKYRRSRSGWPWRIKLDQVRVPTGLEFDRPVISGGKTHWARGRESRQIDVACPDARKGAFSQLQPPCIPVETITQGTAAAGRWSTAIRINVWVPPPLAPVTAIRWGSTSARLPRKSTARMDRSLQPHQVLQMQFRLRAGRAPSVSVFMVGATPLRCFTRCTESA